MTVIVIIALRTLPQRLRKGTRRAGSQTTNGDHPNYSIVEIGHNIEKNSGDLRGQTKLYPFVSTINNALPQLAERGPCGVVANGLH